MNRLVLQRNCAFLFVQLVRIGKALWRWVRRGNATPLRQATASLGGKNPVGKRRAYACAAEVLNRSAYAGTLDGRPTVYAELIRPRYQGGEFNRTRSVNQYLTHWIYPYQGKFHPQMARALLNIAGAREGWVLDPYLGSGTTRWRPRCWGCAASASTCRRCACCLPA